MHVLGFRALLLAVTALLALPALAVAACPDRSGYPGDNAARADIAGWMAFGAAARGVPRELPVMAALVESGLRNLSSGDRDAVGYFQMRTAIWDQGAYAGFPANPQLQLKWFLDMALAVRQQHVDEGDLSYGMLDSQYGNWIADVERPAEQYRGRYQLRLDEARGLIGPPCADVVPPAGETPPAPPLTPAADVTPPALWLARALGPLYVGADLAVPVRCPEEACTVWARGSISIPSATRAYRISAPRQTLVSGARGVMHLPLGPRLREAARAALEQGQTVRGRIVVYAADQRGNQVSASRSIRLLRH